MASGLSSLSRRGPGTTTMGSEGDESAIAVLLARLAKASTTKTTVGVPAFSSSTAAWIHHGVVDPQTPTPTSAPTAISFT